jgi:two-component system, LuxR family, response regulator FixJ
MPTKSVVHVIDDDEAVRESLAFLLRSADLDVSTYESATTFLAALPSVAPGCVITDVRMPGLSGTELLQKLKEMGVKMPVIVMTGHGDVPLAVEAMKMGATDFFEKPFDDEALLTSVQSSLGSWGEKEAREAERADVRARLESLSPRERDVLKGLVAGHPNKTIAFDLGISHRTVEIYRANVMTKMKAASLSELVRMALFNDQES